MPTTKPNPERFDNFMRVYARCLAVCVAKMPDSYGYPVTEVPSVVQRIRGALTTGGFNHDSPAFRESCKDLGIKFTRSSILGYIQGEEPQLAEKPKVLVAGDPPAAKVAKAVTLEALSPKDAEVAEARGVKIPVAPVTIDGPVELADGESGDLAEADLGDLLGEKGGE